MEVSKFPLNISRKFMINDSNIKEDSFTLVTSQRRKTKKHTNKRLETNPIFKPSEEDFVDEEAVIKRIYETQTDLRLSTYYENAIAKLRSVLHRFGSKGKQIVCIGIGHFSECSISRHQLAFILSVKELFGFNSIVFHEPILSRSEVNILKTLNCSVAANNVEGKVEIEGVTLVYAPHCPKQLINNLLWKNWNVDVLKQLIYIGNSFSNLLNSIPSRFLSVDAGFIVKLQPNCEEIDLTNDFKFTDIFNDTSVHQFPTIEAVSNEFWSQETEEPVYESDNLELITTALVEKLSI
ncbi:SRR1-like protein isoform X1 [Sitodiplosis mosellana]|uniref:SRR1-like protein isoform X1 n=1 Tax=Sitodiplosis mosellana TaxID=263140 RepID=UPI002443FC92|nr:SRR1-like protein isoform X1 [Sitodiplosis mosellana]